MTEISRHITEENEIVWRVKERAPSAEYLDRANLLVDRAKEVALAAVEDKDANVKKRVKNAIERRLRPYIEENEILAEQVYSPEYKAFVKDLSAFLGTRPGGVQCSDGRILNIAIFDPHIGVLHRRPQGLPETRASTFDGSPVLEDQTIASSINTTLKKRLREGKNPEIIEFIGPHIDSIHTLHGCGAAKGKVKLNGQPAGSAQESGMKLGGVNLYFDELGNGFQAFDTDIKRAGGEGATFDMTHDSHSQGLIFGLRDAYINGQFDGNKSLRSNLEDLHNNKQILMTELLDEELKDDIVFAKAKFGINEDEKLDIKNPKDFAKNMMQISNVSRDITERYENSEDGFSFLPEHLRVHKSPNAVRTLAYTAIRNSVYRDLVGIKPGEHELLEHPEQLVRVGPIGASFNQNTIAFGQVTPSGLLRPQDEEGIDKLYGLSEVYMPKLKADLKADFAEEGRIILVTEEYDTSRYGNDDAKEDAFERKASNVRRNVAKVKNKFKIGVENGDTIVIGAIYMSDARNMGMVLSSFAKNDNLGGILSI